MNRRIIGALLALPVALVGAVALATPSQATPQPKTDECKTVTHKSGDAFYTVGAGVSEATNDGLYLDTPGPETNAKAGWKVPVNNASLASFESLRYETYQIVGAPDARTVAAIKLTLWPSGKSAVMEPLYGTGQAVQNGTWQSWNALHGDRRWWITGAPDTYLTWEQLKVALPGERVTEVRIEQGSWNHGTESLVRNLKVDIKGKGCHKHDWKAPSLKVKPELEFKSMCDGLHVDIYPGDTRRRWKIVANDFLFVDTISGDKVSVLVPKNKAKTGVQVFVKIKGKWKLVDARTWVKSIECDTPGTTNPTTPPVTPPATIPPATPPATTPPVTSPTTPPPATDPPETESPDVDLVDNTTSPDSLAQTGDESIPTGYFWAIGLILLGSGICAVLAARRRREV